MFISTLCLVPNLIAVCDIIFFHIQGKYRSNIKNLLKLDFPTASFEIFSIFQSLQLKQWKYLKSGSREIQFQQVFDIAKIFPMCVLERGRPELSKSGFIFCISLFGLCVGMH